jgi:hypothetical protein
MKKVSSRISKQQASSRSIIMTKEIFRTTYSRLETQRCIHRRGGWPSENKIVSRPSLQLSLFSSIVIWVVLCGMIATNMFVIVTAFHCLPPLLAQLCGNHPSSCYSIVSYNHCLEKNKLLMCRRLSVMKRSVAASEPTTNKSNTISDVDARVLQTMLEEHIIETGTAEELRKLLERGVTKDIPSSSSTSSSSSSSTRTRQAQFFSSYDVQDDDKAYRSKLLRTLTDNAMWRQVEDAWESVQIRIKNKIENDIQVVAALGIFAWDRAVRDVSRALPASASPRTSFLLSNTSSVNSRLTRPPFFSSDASSSNAFQNDLRESLNRPADELRDVIRQVQEIFDGEGNAIGRTIASKTSRGLRTTVATPNNRAARAAAYQRKQRRQTENRIPLNSARFAADTTQAVVDTAWELRAELKSERGQKAGYKSEPVRQALSAGIAETRNILNAAVEKEKQRRIASSSSVASNKVLLLDSEQVTLSVDDEPEPVSDSPRLSPLPKRTTKSKSKSPWFAASHQDNSEFQDIDDDIVVLPSTIDESDVMAATVDFTTEDKFSETIKYVASEPLTKNTEKDTKYIEKEFTSVLEATLVETTFSDHNMRTASSDQSLSYQVEIVSDVDFDQVFGIGSDEMPDPTLMVDAAVPDEGTENVEDSAAVKLLLRSMDVAFFLAEKTVSTAVPKVVETSSTAAIRIQEVNSNGLGNKGWEKLRHSNPGSRRY